MDDTKKNESTSIPLTSDQEQTTIIDVQSNNKSLQNQYPYIFLTSKSSAGLLKSIIKWFIFSIIAATLIIILYPILIPVYIIVIIQWQCCTIKHRKEIVNDYQYNGCIRVFMNVVLSLGIHLLLTLNALIIGPVLYFLSMTTSKTLAFVPTILFFMFRKSVLFRMAKWHWHFYPNKSLFPVWFLHYFIQKGLRLHHILIYNWERKNVYLQIRDKFKGIITFNAENIPISNFIIHATSSRVFYDIENYIYRFVVIFAISLQLIVPFISTNNNSDLFIHIILSIGIVWIMLVIWMEIEGRIIYELLRYLDRMRQFAELLYLDANNKKDRTKVRIIHYFSVFDKRKRKQNIQRWVNDAPNSNDVIKLCEGNNINIWFNNWFMMYVEANKYFTRYEYIFYSIIAAIITSVVIIIYNFITFQAGETDILNDNVLVTSIGCFTVFLIWIELLMISFKFSKLEKKQKTSLLNQKIYIQQTIFTMECNKDVTKVVDLKQCVRLIDNLMQKMEMNGLSPKIAGITMNQAFVRVTWSLIISVITAGLSFYLKKA